MRDGVDSIFSSRPRFSVERFIRQPDRRRDYGENRIQAIGATEGRILFVVYTDRGDRRRIISALLANAKERARWHSFVKR